MAALRALTAFAYFAAIPYLLVVLTERHDVTFSVATLIVGGATLTARILAIPLGVLADRVGHAPVIAAAAAAGAIGLTAVVASDLFAIAVTGLLLTATGSAAQFVGFNAMVPGLAPAERTPMAFALVGVAYNVGVVLGPAVAGLIALLAGPPGALLCGAIAYAAATLPAILLARRPSSSGVFPQLAEAEHRPSARGALLAVVVLYGATWGILQSLTGQLAPYSLLRYGDAAYAAVFFTTQAILALVVVPLVAPRLARLGTFGRFVSYSSGTLVLLAALPILAVFPGSAWLGAMLTLTLLVTVSEAIAAPVAGALIAELSPRRRHGRAFGMLGAAQAVGIVAASLAGAYGFASWADGDDGAGYWLLVAAVFAPAIVIAATAGALVARRLVSAPEESPYA
jgi:MFS family permease